MRFDSGRDIRFGVEKKAIFYPRSMQGVINYDLNFVKLDERYQMSLVVRKPVLGVSHQVRHKPSYAVTEDG